MSAWVVPRTNSTHLDLARSWCEDPSLTHETPWADKWGAPPRRLVDYDHAPHTSPLVFLGFFFSFPRTRSLDDTPFPSFRVFLHPTLSRILSVVFFF